VPDRTDTPQVLILPPILVAATLAIGYGADRMFHVTMLPVPVARVIGSAAILAGAGLALAARQAMHRAGTNIRPNLPATALVTSGPFQFTRNPFYVAMTALSIGIALWVNSAVMLACLVPMVAVLQFGVIRREERYLEAKFGEPYRAYRALVRRWL
jgi:protein-S-isoprenylcysteine O-methyltransferase Ste14